MLVASQPALILAPMEGVTDAPMRALLSQLYPFAFCVTEFLRVSQDVIPDFVFQRHIPELETQCKTASHCPIVVQLLGGDPVKLAQSALVAVTLGAKAIDINFGCPAPTVNRHDGGATLLKYPERILTILATLRSALPRDVSLSAKVRLGWENKTDIFKIAEAVEMGGASWITIHGRTKVQGYAPPADWEIIGKVKQQLKIPVVANGDVDSLEAFKRCRDLTECIHFMIGRGALSDPNLANEIAFELGIASANPYPWDRNAIGDWIPQLREFERLCVPHATNPGYTIRRIKQWMNISNRKQPLPWFNQIKQMSNTEELWKWCESFYSCDSSIHLYSQNHYSGN